ncbi:GAF and ANTAR domain-containing protein [Pseudonocardia sp. KRD291]|uniref:GAF and ANTAR domain-containing protein n=1 Tax=Pseudonocardia sp. KRD291 TaxID=2792007 RepID=UPI001C4A6BA9|nr:GAF and ANTAR domain-containing protein [Pseudonocardia sp. KRD291]MBW0104703.1 GAF and ANTAR domain-containing protein [Pseudonocardia sp. KRD291]
MQAEQSDELVIALRNAARDLIAHRSITDLEQTLDQIVAAAVETVPGVDAGGVSMTESKHVTSRSPTTGDVRALDELQSELREGPCVTAAEQPPEDGVVLVRDLADGPDAARWPRFAPRAVELGFRSMMSTHLSANGPRNAALNLYSRTPGVFDASARTVAGLFGAQAALLLYGAEHASQMAQALGTRDLIGQAKGILMERFRVDDDRAFQMLVRSSQDTNLKLVEVARWLTSSADQGGAVDARPDPEDRR